MTAAPAARPPTLRAQATAIGRRFVVTFPGPDAPPAALPLHLPAGARTVRLADGALLVLGSDGRAVAIVAAPAAPAFATAALVASTSPAQIAVIVSAAAGPPAYPLVVSVETGTTLVSHTRWVSRGGRRSLEVTPSAWQRRWTSPDVATAAWAEIVHRVPAADTAGMWEQYLCHVQFASAKAVFHLEPWRPAMGYRETVLQLCNPGPEKDLG